MTEKRRGPLPPVLLLGSLLGQGAVHALLPVRELVPGSWRVLGSVPIILGVIVLIMANRRLKVVGTAKKPFDAPSTFVISGPFGFSRNPMYLAILLILIGAALAWGTLTPFAFPPFMAWLLTIRFVRGEEAAMVEAFGSEYEEYRRRVRR